MIWTAFIIMVCVMLVIDLGLFNKEAHAITTKEATAWSIFWVSFASLFSIAIYYIYVHNLVDNPLSLTPKNALITYLTGYIIELSLSVDNLFVIALIFTAFGIPRKYQHRVLFWGILGAIIFRALMIVFGAFLINRFHWLIYIFGVFLLYTAYKMLVHSDDEYDPRNGKIYNYLRRILPISRHLEGQNFFVRKKQYLVATPLFAVLMLIEFTDVIFAIDSIPAILAITTDTFLVFTSNIMAILGLRSMYFFLSNAMAKFEYLHYSLAVVLAFVGLKMILSDVYHIPVILSLGVIIITLSIGIGFSLYKSRKTSSANTPS
ncbi:MAG: TerC family protein [Saprospiraceae bacterium]|nr:TerC family protein [Saprospiraceae bacterium]